MKSKILIIENQLKPLSKIRKFFNSKRFEIIKPKETESVFNLCKTENVAMVIVDSSVFGPRSQNFLENLKNNILPPTVRLFKMEKNQYEEIQFAG